MGISRSKDHGQSPAPGPKATSVLPEHPFKDHVVQYLESVIGPGLVRRQEPYLNDDDLKNLGIQVTGLDLVTGQAQPPLLHNDQFLRPIPPSDVEKWIEESAPAHHEWIPADGEPWNDTNYGEGHTVVNFLDTLTIEGQAFGIVGHIKGPPVIIAYTQWRWHRMETQHLCRSNPASVLDTPLWSAVNFYRPTLDSPESEVFTETLDPDRPHLIATLAEDHEIQQGVALTSEVQIMMLLACVYGIRKAHKQHQLIPVTLITCSWRTCRVIQGIVNLRTRRVELRISKNVELKGGAQKNWDKVLNLLGWMLATPCGQTM